MCGEYPSLLEEDYDVAQVEDLFNEAGCCASEDRFVVPPPGVAISSVATSSAATSSAATPSAHANAARMPHPGMQRINQSAVENEDIPRI